jgi:predicted TIM-barrel fold metal-dependent hydrolase
LIGATMDGANGVVDSHVHIFPPDVVNWRERYFQRDRWFETLYQNPRAKLIDVDALIAAMDEANVERAVLCGFPWSDPAYCREHNDCMADAVRRFPGRLSWLGIVVPGASDAERDVRACFEQGARGIGELNADAQGFDWREPKELRGLVDVCVQAQRPMLVHASEPVGHDYPGKGTATPDRLLAFVSEFRELTVVAAHWGGGLPFLELMPEIELACANVVYDCAASTYLYRPAIFRAVLDLIGPHRVLFGSDYPVLKMDRFLERVLALDWRDEHERSAVLSSNARRVFQIAN